MLRRLLMMPVRLGISVMEMALVTVLSTFSRVGNHLLDAITMWMDRCKNTVVAVTTVVVVFLVLLWMSTFTYWTFYYSYIPLLSHTKDVNFVFSSKCKMRGPCNFPSANVSLSSNGQGVLMYGQQYVVSLELDMPESISNQELGMFMVHLNFFAKHGELVRSAQRVGMMAYKNTIHRIAETVFYLPLLIYNFSQQKQNVMIVLFNNFVEDPYKPVLGAHIELETRYIQLYKATLIIEAQFSGLRYLLFTWPLTSALIGVSFITLFFAVIVLLSWFNLFWSVPDITSTNYTGQGYDTLNQPETLILGPIPPPLNEFEEDDKVIDEESEPQNDQAEDENVRRRLNLEFQPE